MKQIVVISGKGGTGKTTLVASFTVLSQDLVVADCDVDASNLHLLLKPNIKEKHEFMGSKVAVIDAEKCVRCQTCKEACRFNAIKNYQVDPLLCEGCGVCVYVCPANAVSLKEKISGYLFISETKYGPMVHAKLNIAESNSGKLVSLVRDHAKKIAEEENKKFVLIDGPPGIGCPVIASLGNVDLALVVTEPTMSGLHDLQRILSLTQHFGLKTLTLINMYDLNLENTKKIREFCSTVDVEFVGEIPFDPVVVEALTLGKPVVEYSSESKASKKIKDIWEKILSSLS
ncbi:(4Fe-4S)-binding protein [Candidatus Bathyarchaeota archaeon]|nr:MAG: (4Fe-4S)-binding protein [Candidatus Bathyarchaeota archaeon]